MSLPTPSMQLANDPIESLAQTVFDSGALTNRFYDLWTSGPLQVKQIAIFARNYGEFNRSFPEVLSVMISNTQNIQARAEYAKTLYSEMGYGRVDKVHSVLFDNWLFELGKQLGDSRALTWENIKHDHRVLPQTHALIHGEKEMYAADNAIGSGAQLALEWQAYTMLRRMYDGALHYKKWWADEDAFHEACEYFYAHIGATEKEHKIESLNGARQFNTGPQSLLRIEQGFVKHLALFENFWNAIADEMLRAVEPE
ncbi:iron-containing redox enzyme family protein [Pseudomonas sp. L1(2025)]|uniref:iron-containing redox enzyme family protein n=1 Tax=Pseudomonas sp. L1(2025) TaxID=3449429 RepID=UPI003F694C9B